MDKGDSDMSGFRFMETELKGAYLIELVHSADSRGGFCKTFEKSIFQQAGISFKVDESFISRSEKNVIRGLHFQTNEPQAKLVSVPAGKAWDVIVDLRPKSPTFRKWTAAELSAENCLGFYIPGGFAHGFASLEDGTLMQYICDGRYDKETDTGIRFDDPQIGIEWPIETAGAIISSRDLALPSFSFFFGGK